jgi:hypothetical protein
MKYFQSFPFVSTTDYNGNQIALTNLMLRSEIVPTLLNNPLLFYNYDIQDGDTPESIANKYYGDPYRYWIVLYSNQIIDPQWQWPMGPNLFIEYLVDKYTEATANSSNIAVANVSTSQVLSYTQSTIQNYILTLTTYESATSNTTITNYTIDAAAYANAHTLISNNNGVPRYFPNGTYVTKKYSASTQSIYDYEIQQNEANRNINLVNSIYVPQFEQQFKSLMSK